MESLSIWVIYYRPSDYPEQNFVVREQRIFQGAITFQGGPAFAQTLVKARQVIPEGAVNIGRDPADDPVIVESWF